MRYTGGRYNNTMNTPVLTSLAVGSVLNGRFEVESLLNMGGFSLIYRVLDREANRYVVMKECAPEGLVYRDEAGCIQPLSQEGAALMDRLGYNSRYEAYVLSTLTTAGVSNITSYVADFAENGTHYIVMDEAYGRDLHQWAEVYRQQGVPFPAEALEGILSAVLHILHQVHACGFFHCDVKPANIVIADDGTLTLIDFGAVRTAEQQHDDNVQVSPGFSPPEFYPSHRAQIGPWTDIYMLAALFYEIIAGHAPDPANERAVVDRTPRLAMNPKLHKIYRDVFLISIDKALNLDHRDRFASAELWKEAYTILKAGPKLKRGKTSYLQGIPGAAGAVSMQSLQRARNAHVFSNNSHGPLASGAITAGAGSIKIDPAYGVKVQSSGTPWGMIVFILVLAALGAVVADQLGYIELPFELPEEIQQIFKGLKR